MLRHIGRITLGSFLAFAGAGHLSWSRIEFQAQVPPWIPLDPDFVVVSSGIVEIILGLGLLFWRSKRAWFGWFAALFFVLIFPGNIAQYVEQRDAFGLNTDEARLTRLFFQPVLVLLALWSTHAWRERYTVGIVKNKKG